MNDKTHASFMNVGSSSLLVIFLALCLSTFSVLALSTAKSDYAFSQKTAEHRAAYYTAANTAEEMLAELDLMIQNARVLSEADAFNESFIFALASQLKNEYTYDTITQNVHFSVPVTDKQTLFVTVQLLSPTEVLRYTITRFTVENTAEWAADDTPALYLP